MWNTFTVTSLEATQLRPVGSPWTGLPNMKVIVPQTQCAAEPWSQTHEVDQLRLEYNVQRMSYFIIRK